MKKTTLNKKVDLVKKQTKDALQIMYAALNQGQQRQIIKNEAVKELFDRYGVEY